MAKGAYIGVGSVARKVKKLYIGVGGVARKIKKLYIGVGGVARLWWSGALNLILSIGDSNSSGYTFSYSEDLTSFSNYKMVTNYGQSLVYGKERFCLTVPVSKALTSMISYDGKTWTTGTALTAKNINECKVFYANGYFIAFCSMYNTSLSSSNPYGLTIYVSTDGLSWSNPYSYDIGNLPAVEMSRVVFDYHNGTYAFMVSSYNVSHGNCVIYTTSPTGTWTNNRTYNFKSQSIATNGTYVVYSGYSSSTWYIYYITVATKSVSLAKSGTFGSNYSEQTGATSIIYSPSRGTFYAALGACVYSFTNPSSMSVRMWLYSNTNLNNRQYMLTSTSDRILFMNAVCHDLPSASTAPSSTGNATCTTGYTTDNFSSITLMSNSPTQYYNVYTQFTTGLFKASDRWVLLREVTTGSAYVMRYSLDGISWNASDISASITGQASNAWGYSADNNTLAENRTTLTV